MESGFSPTFFRCRRKVQGNKRRRRRWWTLKQTPMIRSVQFGVAGTSRKRPVSHLEPRTSLKTQACAICPLSYSPADMSVIGPEPIASALAILKTEWRRTLT
jgi:hypothetical protein